MKQRQVVAEELREVDVDDRAQHQDVFALVGVLELEVAGRRQHRLDRPHTVVVVTLRRKLFRAQPIRRHDLKGQKSTGITVNIYIQGGPKM